MAHITTPDWDKNSWIASPDYIQQIVRFISTELSLSPVTRMLDIGCGRGAITQALAQAHQFLIPIEGIDPSPVIQEQQKNTHLVLHQSDANEYLQYQPADQYDAVLIKQVCHLLPYYDRYELFKAIKRCLKPSGRVMILQMMPRISMPMFASGVATFSQECLTVKEMVDLGESLEFKTRVSQFHYPVSLDKAVYYDLLRMRFMSNLRTLSDAQIEQGIEELEVLCPGPVVQFSDDMDCIHFSAC